MAPVYIFFLIGTNQSCFQTLTHKESFVEAGTTRKQGTQIRPYSPTKEPSVIVTAAALTVPCDPGSDLCYRDHPELRQTPLYPTAELLQATRELKQLASGSCEKQVGWADWYSRIRMRPAVC